MSPEHFIITIFLDIIIFYCGVKYGEVNAKEDIRRAKERAKEELRTGSYWDRK